MKLKKRNYYTVKFSKEEEKSIIDMYISNTLSYVSKIFNCATKTIKKVLIKNNVTIRSNGTQHMKFTNESIFDNIDSHDKAYWLGFLAADGNISKRGQLTLQLSEKDRNHLIKFYDFMESKGKIGRCITKLNGKQYIGYRISFKSDILKNDLKKHNIIPNKSSKLQLSSRIPNKFLNSYIRGLIDGDGSFYLYKNRMSFNLVSSVNTCKQVQKILIQNCGLNKVKIYPMNNNKYCYITYCGNINASKIAKFIYKKDCCPTFLERKKDLVFRHLGDRLNEL